MGIIGLAPSEFDDMTFAEFDAAEQGYMRRMTNDYRVAMGIQRYGSFAVMSAMADLGGRDATEILPLPWDNKPTKQTGNLSKKELAQMQREALETAKRFEEWAKR